MTDHLGRCRSGAIAFALLLLAATNVHGQTSYVWNNMGANWNDPASWTVFSGSGTEYPGFAATDMAIFDPQIGGFSSTNPSISGSFDLQSLLVANTPALGNTTFNGTGTLTLSSSAALGGLTISGAGTTVFDGPSIAGFSSSKTAVISIGHGAGLTLTGASVANTYLNYTLVQGGTLTVDNSSTNTLNRFALGGSILYLQDSGTFNYVANAAGGASTISTATTGLNFTSGNDTVEITLSSQPSGQTILVFGGYTRALMTGASIDFVLNTAPGVTATLGGTGADDPLIRFTQTTNLTPYAGDLMRANSAGGSGGMARGMMFVNGTDFATWSTTTSSVTALVGTPVDSTSLSGASGNVTFTPDAGGTTTLTAGTTLTSLKIVVPAGEATLNLGSNYITTQAILLPGSNDYAITGGSSSYLFGNVAGSGSKTVYVTQPTTVLSVGVSMSAPFPFTKSGAAILALTGTSDQLNLTNQSIYLNQGVLQAAPGTNLGISNVLEFRGGVLEISNGATFGRDLGISSTGSSSNGYVNWSAGNMDAGSGGFSAINSPAAISMAEGSQLIWGQQYFVPVGSALMFGSVDSNQTVIWQNPLGLDSGTPGTYAVAEIEVTRGTGAATDKTSITGTISGSISTDLLKTGTGVLELAEPAGNTYAGNTLVDGGTLLVSNTSGSATGTGTVTIGSGGNLAGTGFIGPSTAVTVLAGGTVSPGNPTGTLTVTAPVALAATSTLAWSLANASPAPASANSGLSNASTLQSQLTISGTGNTLTAGGAVTFQITEVATPTFIPGQTYSWLVANTQGTPTLGSVTFDLTDAPTFAAYGGAAELSLQTSGMDVYLNFTPIPVPEPADGLAIAAGLLALGRIRRWQRGR